MNKAKYLIASGALVVSLLAAAPAFASEGINGTAGFNSGFNLGIRLAPIARFFENDKVNAYGKFNNDTVGSTSISAGTVSSVDGNTFVVSPAKSGTATTTVVTDASTVFKVNGTATTSAALTSGARVIVIGTTTATSTSGTTVEASLVLIFTKVVGFCKHWMHI